MPDTKRFKPPKAMKQPEWASWIPDRSPQFKMHKTEGQCKQAFSYTLGYEGVLRRGIVYRWNGEEWTEVYDFTEGTKRLGHEWWAEIDRKNHVRDHNHYAAYGERLRAKGEKPSHYSIERACEQCGMPKWQMMGYSERPCTDRNCIHC